MRAVEAGAERPAQAVRRTRAATWSPAGLARTLGLVTLAGLWAWFLYATSWHTRTPNSDNANAVLAGRDMAQGNVLLRGWTLPTDTFWSVDLPVYGIVSRFQGITPSTLFLVPALVGVAVLVVAWGFRPLERGPAPTIVAGGVMVTLLGFPHPALGFAFLQGPHHVATTLLCLVSFRLLNVTTVGVRWAAGTAVLGAAVLGDPLAIALGALPIVAGAVLGWWRSRRLRPFFASAGGAALAVAGAALLGRALHWAGGYRLAPPLPLSPPGNWDENLRAVPRQLGWLLGVGRGSGLDGLYRTAHLAGLALFVAAVAGSAALALARRPRQATAPHGSAPGIGGAWLDDVLLMGVLGGIAAYVVIVLPTVGIDPGGGRYVIAPLVYGAILAGRRAGEVLRLAPGAVPVAAVVLVVVASLYLATSVSVLRGPKAPNEAAAAASWLVERGLSDGYAQYWSASILTVESRGRARVRPVVAVDGKLHGNPYYASAAWFTAGEGRPTFVVVSGDRLDDVGEDVATTTFGPPATSADVGRYRILVWDRDLRPGLGPLKIP